MAEGEGNQPDRFCAFRIRAENRGKLISRKGLAPIPAFATIPHWEPLGRRKIVANGNKWQPPDDLFREPDFHLFLRQLSWECTRSESTPRMTSSDRCLLQHSRQRRNELMGSVVQHRMRTETARRIPTSSASRAQAWGRQASHNEANREEAKGSEKQLSLKGGSRATCWCRSTNSVSGSNRD